MRFPPSILALAQSLLSVGTKMLFTLVKTGATKHQLQPGFTQRQKVLSVS